MSKEHKDQIIPEILSPEESKEKAKEEGQSPFSTEKSLKLYGKLVDMVNSSMGRGIKMQMRRLTALDISREDLDTMQTGFEASGWVAKLRYRQIDGTGPMESGSDYYLNVDIAPPKPKKKKLGR